MQETSKPIDERPWADFEHELVRIGTVSLQKHSHRGGKTAAIYGTPWAAEALKKYIAGPRTWPGEFRTGSMFVQSHEDGTVYVMRKRPLGRLSNSKDWYFALEREGRIILQSGTTPDKTIQEACINCHATLAAKSDWVIPPGRSK